MVIASFRQALEIHLGHLFGHDLAFRQIGLSLHVEKMPEQEVPAGFLDIGDVPLPL